MNSCPHCNRPYDTYIRVGGSIRQKLFDYVRASPRGVTRQQIERELYSGRIDGGPLNTARVIWVVVCQLNKILEPYQLRVQSEHGSSGSLYKLIALNESKAPALGPRRDGLSHHSRRRVHTAFLST